MAPSNTNDVDLFVKQVRKAQEHHDRGIDLCYMEKDYTQALTELREAILLRESLLGKYHNDTALSYFRIICVLSERLQEWEDALILARREFRMSSQLLGSVKQSLMLSSDPWISERVGWFKDIMKRSQLMDRADAENYCSQLIKSVEYERLGDILLGKGKWEAALKEYTCALALESSAFARNPLDIADLHVKIGNCMVALNDVDPAMQEYDTAIFKYDNEFGPENTYSAKILRTRATILLRKKKYDRALATYANAYTLYQAIFGFEHELAKEALADIKLVTVKEMEDLRNSQRRREKAAREESNYDYAETRDPCVSKFEGLQIKF